MSENLTLNPDFVAGQYGARGREAEADPLTNPGLGTMAVAGEIAAVADLNQTISAAPTQGEVQAISDKVDELLAAMRAADHMRP